MKITRICLSIIATTLALTSSFASGQQTVSVLAGLTPNPLRDGSAKLAGHYNSGQKLRLVIGLQHPHLAEEEEFLKELQTKGSPNFQKFLTADEWNSRFGPSAADEQAVVDWATSQGLTVSRRFPNRLLVDLEAPAAAIEKAFGVTMNSYQVGTRMAFSNDRDPVIPVTLASIIHSVGGLNSIQVLRPHSKNAVEPAFADYAAGPALATGGAGGLSATAKRPTKPTGPTANITNGAYDPSDIYSSQAYDVQALYNQGHCCNPLNNSGVTPPSSSIAIATAGSQNAADFVGFHNAYPYLALHYRQFYINGSPACCDGEGTMDFEWSTAWSNSFGGYQNTAMVYLYDGVNALSSTFTDIYNDILSDQNAKIFSTSWGCEETTCIPNSVMDTDHGIFNSMAAQGMTLVAASGDQGATAGCGDAVAVQYPASDPNIVGAGGTTLRLYSNSNYYSETAWTGGPDGCSTNDGGSTGGYSSYYAKPWYQANISGLGSQRYVPDIALNADWYNTPQNYYFNGELSGNGGTSIVAPSIAGFFAQTNAYLDYVATVNGGCFGATTCSPIGSGNAYLYWFGTNPTYSPHYPFYDITAGCNSNDITTEYGLNYFCAASGYDPVTGWGSFNALQLARAITTYRAYYGTTTADFSAYTQPVVNHWYNTDQTVQWNITAAGQLGYNSTGIAGFSQSWDTYLYDSTSEATPGSGDAFYSGPQNPNATYGSQNVSSAGQGCHTAQVLSWDNSGGSGYQTYGPVCYDTVPPVTTAALSGTSSGGIYTSTVKATLSATDASSGVQSTIYSLDYASSRTYSSPFSVSGLGSHVILYRSSDVAGNFESPRTLIFSIESPTTTTVTSSLNPSTVGASVTFTAKVAASSGSVPAGTVTFKDGIVTLGGGTLTNGTVTFSTTTMVQGPHSITAVYGGSSTDVAGTSAVLTQVVQGPPSVGTLSPIAGTGAVQTFTAVYTDPNGTSDLSAVKLIFSPSPINGVKSCLVIYEPATNGLYLANDANSANVGPLTPGASSSLSNSQCTLAGTGTTITKSGTTLTAKFALTFTANFTGSRYTYTEAIGAGGTTGWIQKGTWVPVSLGPPTAGTLAPTSGTGSPETFSATYADPNGLSDLTVVKMLFSAAPINGVHACILLYEPATNGLYLSNDVDTGNIGPIVPGTSSFLGNSQCTLSGAGTSVTRSGNTITVKYALTFNGSYAGSKNTYLEAVNNSGTTTGWVQKGTWVPVSLGPPTTGTISPASGTGAAQTFTTTFTDPNGIGDLSFVKLLVSAAPLNGVNACIVYYEPANNALYMANNANNGSIGPLTPGAPSSISNSQCTLPGAGTSVTTSGNTITVKFALTFASTYTGLKNTYLQAVNNFGTTTGSVLEGSWIP